MIIVITIIKPGPMVAHACHCPHLSALLCVLPEMWFSYAYPCPNKFCKLPAVLCCCTNLFYKLSRAWADLYVYIYIYIYIYIHVRIYIYIYICIHTYVYIYICIRVMNVTAHLPQCRGRQAWTEVQERLDRAMAGMGHHGARLYYCYYYYHSYSLLCFIIMLISYLL